MRKTEEGMVIMLFVPTTHARAMFAVGRCLEVSLSD